MSHEIASQPTPEAGYLRTGLLRIGLATSVLLGVGAVSETPHTRAEPVVEAEYVTSTAEVEACPTPTREEITTATSVIEPPRITLLPQQPEQSAKGGLLPEKARSWVATQQELAESHGLTIVDNSPLLQQFSKDAPHLFAPPSYEKPAELLPIETYFSAASEFLANYGVELTAAEPGDKHSPYGEGVPKSSLDSRYTRRTLYEIIQNFGQLPVELVRYAQLEQIVLIRPHNSNIAAYVDGENSPGAMFIDPHIVQHHDVVRHELFHMIDTAQCGSQSAIYTDSKFAELNPADIYQESYGNYLDLQTAITNSSQLNPLFVRPPLLSPATTDGQIVATSSSGFSNMVEDKAEIGKHLLSASGYTSYLLNEQNPVLREKALFLASRLYNDMPGVVRYLVATAHYRHPSSK